MSLNITEASVTPNVVTTGTKFVISVEVFDDAFEMSNTTLVYDKHQGFADNNQTIGGKLQ